MHLHLCHPAADSRRYNPRSQPRWHARRAVPSERRASTDSREEVVHGTASNYHARRNIAVRIDLHRNVKILWKYGLNEFLIRVTILRFLISFRRYFIFTSFWAYKIYYVYGFMLLVFVILMIVTVCVTIVCTYFLLNAEDYRW